MAEEALNFSRIGDRARTRRLQFGLSTREVADRAGVARGTVVRLERGEPCLSCNIDRIARALCLYQDDLLRPVPQSERFAVHRGHQSRWLVSRAKSEYQYRTDEAHPLYVDDVAERHRLGALGFQPFYTAPLESALSDGILRPALMELHQPTWIVRHYGEEFVYCLRGDALIQIEDETCRLSTGDSVTFDANQPHQYLPAPDESGVVPLILCVVGFRLGRESLTLEPAP